VKFLTVTKMRRPFKFKSKNLKAGFPLHLAPNQRAIEEEAKWFSCVSFWICGAWHLHCWET